MGNKVGNIGGACEGLEPVIKIVKNGILKYICILIPIALLLFGVFDLGKAVIASDEEEVKAAQSRLIKRVIYAVVVFLVPQLVSLIMGIVSIGITDGSTGTWATCWNSIYIVNK